MPIRTPGGRSLIFLKRNDTNASSGLPRLSKVGMTNLSDRLAGTSLTECTAISIVPASNASSSSFKKRPLPPIAVSGRSCILSPWVVIPTISTARSGSFCSSCWRTFSAWARASGLLRVPRRIIAHPQERPPRRGFALGEHCTFSFDSPEKKSGDPIEDLLVIGLISERR